MNRCSEPRASKNCSPARWSEQLQKCVLEAVENFARGAHQADDLTLLIVRYRATAATTDTDVPLASSSSSSASVASV
jgi:hypothetical protein